LYLKTTEEAKLLVLASWINQEYPYQYSSHFHEIVKILLEEPNIIKVKNIPKEYDENISKDYDFNFVFTITQSSLNDRELIRLCQKKMNTTFGRIAKTRIKDNFVEIRFKDDISCSISFLPYSHFRLLTIGISYVEKLNEVHEKAIILTKFWKDKKNKNRIKSSDIENKIITSQYNQIIRVLMDVIHHFDNDPNQVIDFLLTFLNNK